MTATTASDSSSRILGGETGHRSMFGPAHSKLRVTLLLLVVAGSIFPAMLWQSPWPLALAVVTGPLVIAFTQKTHRGTVVGRVVRRRRWASRVRHGHDRFDPYTPEAWAAAQDVRAIARTRAARREANRGIAAVRAMPDGADGMGWLQSAPNVPGIAWHTPTGEQSRLTVAFEVGGQLVGLQTRQAVDSGAEAFGRFLASHAPSGKLLRGVQTITRVLPADIAEQQLWTVERIAEGVPHAVLASYDEVIRETGRGAMVQRHYIVCTWPITEQFTSDAASRGAGTEGWRRLMAEEIRATAAQLRHARYTFVRPLTARQLTAAILHQQAPDRPVDQVADVDPASPGIASRDQFSAHVTRHIDEDGDTHVWWHRTCRVDAADFAVSLRRPLWHMKLFTGDQLDFIRTVSFHHQLVPASDARTRAQKDVVSDEAEKHARRSKGKVEDTALDVTQSAAKRRNADLAPGTHHHGDTWLGYITITTSSREGLQAASRQLTDLCADVGIDAVTWLDSYQAAASGTTWPIGRGQSPASRTLAGRIGGSLAGKRSKEEL